MTWRRKKKENEDPKQLQALRLKGPNGLGKVSVCLRVV